MSAKFADTIYQTHSDWGEVVITDEKHMRDLVKSLSELGKDWASCSIEDCTPYTLMRDLGNGNALYEGDWRTEGYNRAGRYSGVVFSRAAERGYYKRVETLDSAAEFGREFADQ